MKKLIFSFILILSFNALFAQADTSSKDSILEAKYVLCINTKGDTVRSYLPAPPGYAFDIINYRYVRVDKKFNAKEAKKEEYVPWPDWIGYRH